MEKLAGAESVEGRRNVAEEGMSYIYTYTVHGGLFEEAGSGLAAGKALEKYT